MYFSSSLCVQTNSEAHPASCTMGIGGSFPRCKARPGLDAVHSVGEWVTAIAPLPLPAGVAYSGTALALSSVSRPAEAHPWRCIIQSYHNISYYFVPHFVWNQQEARRLVFDNSGMSNDLHADVVSSSHIIANNVHDLHIKCPLGLHCWLN
jgi:hypothetical protein